MPFGRPWKRNVQETDKQIEGIKKELGKEKYNEIVVRAFVESILKESPIIKGMQARIEKLEHSSKRTP